MRRKGEHVRYANALKSCKYAEPCNFTYLATLDTTDPDGANADTDAVARKRAATVRRGAMVLIVVS
jgi:hypothetical protein